MDYSVEYLADDIPIVIYTIGEVMIFGIQDSERGLNEESSVLFVGVNVGGVLAKVLGMRTGHRGLGLISTPALNREFIARYEFTDQETPFLTNIFNMHGLWSIEEESAGENMAIPGPFKTLDRDSVYISFCNLAEMCGYHTQFNQYCETAIGSDKIAVIRQFFGLDGE
jgi:hypothetical protein